MNYRRRIAEDLAAAPDCNRLMDSFKLNSIRSASMTAVALAILFGVMAGAQAGLDPNELALGFGGQQGICCTSHFAYALDSPQKTGIQFLGEIQSVDAAHGTVTVKHAKIPGYAAAGMAEYSVENEAVVKSLHPGDDIRATVYPDDRTLHNLRVIYRPHPK